MECAYFTYYAIDAYYKSFIDLYFNKATFYGIYVIVLDGSISGH